jgi:hypothetical protein
MASSNAAERVAMPQRIHFESIRESNNIFAAGIRGINGAKTLLFEE